MKLHRRELKTDNSDLQQFTARKMTEKQVDFFNSVVK